MIDTQWAPPGKGSWQLESAHFPTPISPYHAEILTEQFPRGFAAGTERLGILLSHFDHAVVNGFDYITPRIVGAPEGANGTPPYPVFKLISLLHPAVRRRLKSQKTVFERKPWRDDVALWQQTIRPESERRHLDLQRFDVVSASDDELAEHLEALHANASQQYYVHHRFTISSLTPVGDYLVKAREWTGLPDGVLMQACRQPEGIATVARAQFEAVVEALRADRSAQELLRTGPHAAENLAQLAARTDAVGETMRVWLEMTGNRLMTGYDIVDLTAIEMPDLLIRTLLAALDDSQIHAREETRAALAAKVRAAVPTQHKAEYEAVLAEALFVGSLREERALVCDFWAYGLVRRAILEAGRRLADRDRIAEPTHLLDASHSEILELVRGTGGPEAAELKDRHAYRITATADDVPKVLGPEPAPPPPPSWYPVGARRMNAAIDAAVKAIFDEPVPRTEPKAVHGLPAAAGRYEGTARVILRPDDFGRITRGDVLVARMTTEAYNGIMPLLGAVVTDRGGLLSHTATVAREFGIPAVVGSSTATRLIPDGARVVVDGDRGVATLT
ncbi:PEP-utilizing enzyme [Antrihabitans stalactiti]|nr:PEP-utilizing enzyme [Antrihabitans stalactiti]